MPRNARPVRALHSLNYFTGNGAHMTAPQTADGVAHSGLEIDDGM